MDAVSTLDSYLLYSDIRNTVIGYLHIPTIDYDTRRLFGTDIGYT